MPTTNTAEKEMRAAERRRARAKSIHSQTKTEVRRAEEAITSGNNDNARDEVKKAISALDKEAGKNQAHRNSAARRKSRLMKKLNKAAAASKAEPAKK